MKFKELTSLSEEEMEKKLHELYENIMRENAQVATGTTPKSPGQLKNMKKTIARIKTLQRRKTRA